MDAHPLPETADAVEAPRCRAGRRCDGAEILYDEEGHRLGTVGALADGLCRACYNHVCYSLGSLAGDVEELSGLLQPSAAPKYADPDMPRTPTKAASKLPLRADVLDLRNLIDFEVTTWAASTNPAWNVRRARQGTQQARVQVAADILHRNASIFLALPAHLHRARSLQTNRGDGHDPDTTTRLTTDIWVRRDGITAGLTLLALHEKALTYAGRGEGESMNAPCPTCTLPRLCRSAGTDRTIVCQSCWSSFPDAQFESFLDGAYASAGLAEFSPLAGPRYDATPYRLLDRLGKRIVAADSARTPAADRERNLKITPRYRGRLVADLATNIPHRTERDRMWAATLAEAYTEHHEREKAARRAIRAAERAAAREARQTLVAEVGL